MFILQNLKLRKVYFASELVEITKVRNKYKFYLRRNLQIFYVTGKSVKLTKYTHKYRYF